MAMPSERVHHQVVRPTVLRFPLKLHHARSVQADQILVMPCQRSGSSIPLRIFPTPATVSAGVTCPLSPIENILTLAVYNPTDTDVVVRVEIQYPTFTSAQDVAAPAGELTYYDGIAYSFGPLQPWEGPTRAYAYTVTTGDGFDVPGQKLASLTLVETAASAALADPVNNPPLSSERVFPSQALFLRNGSLYHSFFSFASIALRPPASRGPPPLPAEFGCVTSWNDHDLRRGDRYPGSSALCLPYVPLLVAGYYLGVPMTLKYHVWSSDGYLFPGGVPYGGNMLMDATGTVFDVNAHTNWNA